MPSTLSRARLLVAPLLVAATLAVSLAAAPANASELEPPQPGSITGSVELPWRGVITSRVYAVEVWKDDPVSTQWTYAGSASGESGSTFRVDGLEPGRYAVRAEQSVTGPAATPAYRPAFLGGSALRDESTIVEVTPGGTVSGVDFSLDGWRWSSDRIAGADRYGTAAELSRRFVETGIPVLYVASGANWPDALSAGPAAAHLGGSLLTTDPDSLPLSTEAEIRRLSPGRVVVVGSEKSVSESVLRQIAAIVPDISRIGGADRYETSRLVIADAYETAPEYTYLATGANFPDALAVAGAAGALSPVVLVDGGKPVADDATKDLLRSLKVRAAQAVGGEPSIPSSLMRDLVASRAIERDYRIAGSDRYGTAAQLVGWAPWNDGRAFVASGEGFADALAVSAIAARTGTAVALTERSCLRSNVGDALGAAGHPHMTLLGQDGRISGDVVWGRC